MDAATGSSLFNWMLTILATVGLTTIINSSYLFKGVRSFFIFNKHLHKFIHCPMCVGFWSGLFLSGYSLKYALAGSISSYTWYLITKELVNKFD